MAQSTQATGSLSGRVFIPTTGEYVKFAEVSVAGTELATRTGEAGSYFFADVPAGAQTVTVRFAGYETASAIVQVTAATTATQDFELREAGSKGDEAIVLSAFTVTAERQGEAKMIQERRSTTTIANVVTADALGDITQGNIGDFLKYLPGFTFISGDSDDPQFGMLGGLDSQYMNVAMDGARMAGVPSDFNGEGDQGARAFNFTQVSINSIESISVERTVGAESPGDGTAGKVNLRTKSAFDRKGRFIEWQVNGTINSGDFDDVINFRRSRGPNDSRSYKVSPGLMLGYSETFFGNRFGVSANVGISQAIRNASRLEVIDRLPPNNPNAQQIADNAGPVNEFRFQDAPGLTQRYNANLNLEYRPARRVRLFLRGGYNYQERDNHARQVQLIAPTLDMSVSSLTRLEPVSTATNGSIGVANGSSSRSENKVVSVGTGFDLGVRNFKVDGRVDYSRSDRNDGSLFRADYLGRQDSRVSNISWRAERPDKMSPEWKITQLTGPDWRDPNNWVATGTSSGQDGLTWGSELSSELNGSADFAWKVPFKVSAGISSELTKKHFDLVARKQFSYTPNGIAANQARLPLSPYRLDVDVGSNLFPLVFPSREELGNQLRAHPEWFGEAALGDSYGQMLRRDKDAEEHVLGYYAKLTSRYKRLTYDIGYRFTHTDRSAFVVNPVPDNRNPLASVVKSNNRTNTQNAADNSTVFTAPDIIQGIIDYSNVRYNNGVATERKSNPYTPPLFRGSVKLQLLKNTDLRFGYVEGYQQPNLSDVAGEPVIDTTNFIFTIPNPALKPQSSKRYSLELLHTFEPIGLFSIHFAQAEIKNAQIDTEAVDAATLAEIDPTLDFQDYIRPNGESYTFRTKLNDPSGALRLNRAIELEYRYQFRKLPGFWRGFGVFGTYSKYTTNRTTGRFSPKSASGGMSFGLGRFNSNLRALWVDDVRTSGSSNLQDIGSRARYIKARTTLDLNLRYRIYRNVEVYVSGKNITNEPTIQYFPTGDGRLERYINPGALWTVGVKGTF